MNRLNMTNIADKMASRISTVAAAMVDSRVINSNVAQVVVEFNHVNATPDVLHAAVAKAFSNKARPIEGSFRAVASYGQPSMVGFVALNRETRPYTEAAATKMKALASNMLMDASDDSLWEVTSDGNGGKLMARQQPDDLSALLVTARVRKPRTTKLSEVMSAFNAGDFVAFVDPQAGIVRHGYVTANNLEVVAPPVGGITLDEPAVEILVLDKDAAQNVGDNKRDEDNAVAERMIEDDVLSMVVTSSLIVEVAYLNGSDAVKEVAAPVNSQSKESMKAYYKELYGYAPDYYAEVVKMIDQHAGF